MHLIFEMFLNTYVDCIVSERGVKSALLKVVYALLDDFKIICLRLGAGLFNLMELWLKYSFLLCVAHIVD